ncbi:MAG TPA: hypothetical protein VNI54_17250 [Thermoanaerobaculia bacterium]|nr:hypothetical protein [Thermoanaerobaculia bacterium]
MIASDRRIAVGLFILTFVTYAWFFGGGGWNQNAHFDLTRALVERQTFHIDGYRVNSGDIAWSNVSGQWHAYSNKPPGLPFLAAIPYFAIYHLERALHVPVDSWLWMTINVYALTLLVVATCGAGIAVLVFRWARPHTPHAVLIALIAAFGTIILPYSQLFFSPVPAAFFLLLAYVLLERRPVLAGAAAGIAGLCFYICIPAAAVLAIAARRKAWKFILGGLPFGALLAWYHTVCFGAPWRTSLETAQNFTERGLLLGLFRTYPTKLALWGLTFSEYRGLFVVSPVLLLAIFGLFRMKRRDAAIIVSIFAVFLLMVASFNGWEGGSSFGPRHILPAIPFLVLPLAFVRARWLLLPAVVSFAINLLATAIDASPPGGIQRPIRDFYLAKRAVSINEQTVDELIPHQLYAEGSRESEWASLNLGEFALGAGNPWSVAPIVVWVVVGGVWLRRVQRPSQPTVIPSVVEGPGRVVHQE